MSIETVCDQDQDGPIIVLSDEAIIALNTAGLRPSAIGPNEKFIPFFNQPQSPERDPGKQPDDSYNVD